MNRFRTAKTHPLTPSLDKRGGGLIAYLKCMFLEHIWIFLSLGKRGDQGVRLGRAGKSNRNSILKLFLLFLVLLSGFSPQAFPQAPDPEFVKAQTLESQGKNEEALAIYSLLYNRDKTDLYFFRLVMLCERIGDFKTMGEVARNRLSSRPDDLSAVNYLSHSLYGQGKNSEGRSILMESIGNKWTDIEKVRNAANEFMTRNDLASALSVYLTAREKTGNRDIYSFELAQIYRIQLNYAQAIGEFLKTLENQPMSFGNIELLIKAALDDKADPRYLLAPLSEYQKTKPADLRAARLISGLKYRIGDYEGAYRSLLEPAVSAKNPADLWNMCERLNEEGHIREAILSYSDFYRYFKTSQNGKAALLKCAALREKGGDSEGAKKDYLTLAADFPGTVEESLASLRIMELSPKGTGDDLVSKLRSFVSASLDQSVACEANLFLGQTCLKQGNAEEAGKALTDALLKARSKNEIYDVTSTMALMHFFTGAYDLMTLDIESCVGGFPDHENANDLLALRVLTLRSATPKERNDLAKYSYGRYCIYRGLSAEGIDSLTVAAGDTSSAVAPEAARFLGDYYRESGDSGKAFTWYSQAVSAAGDTTVHVGAMMDLAELYVNALNDEEAAKKLYVDALTLFPGSVYEGELRNRLRNITDGNAMKQKSGTIKDKR